jgi:hypothetical protein
MRPAALRRGRWADTSRRPFPVSTRAWLLERAKLRDFTFARACCRARPQGRLSGGLDLHPPEKLSFKKTVVASKRDRPDVAHRRVQCRKYQDRTEPERLVFIETWTGAVIKSGSRKANAVRQFIW